MPIIVVDKAVQAGRSVMLEHCVYPHASSQQELDCVGSAVSTARHESILHLLLRRRRLQSAILVEEAFDGIQPSNSRRALQVQPCASDSQRIRPLLAKILDSVRRDMVQQSRVMFPRRTPSN